MTFLFLDRVAGIVGEPDSLVEEARARIFKEPVRHEGLRRLPRDEVRAHVASVVVRVANDRLRQPLMDAVDAHAREAAEIHTMMHGDDALVRDAVIEAFASNDVGIDMTVFGDGEATPEAVADQVLRDAPDADVRVLQKMGVPGDLLDGIVDEILTPMQVEWSLDELAALVQARGQKDGNEHEITQYLLSNDFDLRVTGLAMCAPCEGLGEWLDERAMFSSPEQDEADVAEVLRLIDQKGGGSPDTETGATGDVTAAGAEPDEPAPAADPEWKLTTLHGNEALKAGSEALVKAREQMPMMQRATEKALAQLSAPVAAEPSDVTRAVAAALKTLFDHTKETDVHMAEVLGVPKAVVAQSRKDVTPWSPDADQMGSLRALVGRYNDALAAAAGALNALEGL